MESVLCHESLNDSRLTLRTKILHISPDLI
jgi:hypothetical protein